MMVGEQEACTAGRRGERDFTHAKLVRTTRSQGQRQVGATTSRSGVWSVGSRKYFAAAWKGSRSQSSLMVAEVGTMTNDGPALILPESPPLAHQPNRGLTRTDHPL